MFNRNLNLRIDDNTDVLLKTLAFDLNFSKAEIVRRAVRLLKELNEIKKQGGEFLVRSEKGEEKLILLG
jgi:hypothetical protein